MDRSDIFNLTSQTTTTSKTPNIGDMFKTILTEAGAAAKELIFNKTQAEIARLTKKSESAYPSAVNQGTSSPKATAAVNGNGFVLTTPMIIIGIILIFVVLK